MAKKGNRVQVIMECTEHKASGMPGTSRYITTKNKKNTRDSNTFDITNPMACASFIHPKWISFPNASEKAPISKTPNETHSAHFRSKVKLTTKKPAAITIIDSRTFSLLVSIFIMIQKSEQSINERSNGTTASDNNQYSNK